MRRVKSLMDMMVGSCEETRAQLSDHLEGELKGMRGLRVRLHLAGCDACSAVARSLRATIERLHTLDEHFTPDPAPSVVPAVLDRIRHSDRR
jgi:predicted anti-sigma-YlaC factor YlaD